ncbi:hypothetical protein BJ166DRAFT_498447 [Pestalotiopsis sp. NC0098]|nr:hypothetical protein BJ166DRAFT_498447 [Pestalotiopsis sp. NC0098]
MEDIAVCEFDHTLEGGWLFPMPTRLVRPVSVGAQVFCAFNVSQDYSSRLVHAFDPIPLAFATSMALAIPGNHYQAARPAVSGAPSRPGHRTNLGGLPRKVRVPFSALSHPPDQATSSTAVGDSEGTLSNFLNDCVTPFGKRMFRQWVCHPLCNTL